MTTDSVLDALYAGLNAVDVPGLEKLYLPGATIVRCAPFHVHTVASWSAGLASVFTEHEELELGRRTERHGALAHVVSRFAIRHRTTRATVRTGTNSFSLVHDGARWWIASAVWVVD